MTKEFGSLKFFAQTELEKQQRKVDLCQKVSISTSESMQRRLKTLTTLNNFFKVCTAKEYEAIMKARKAPKLKRVSTEPDKNEDLDAWVAWHKRKVYRESRNLHA